jgi:hypothetical protein
VEQQNTALTALKASISVKIQNKPDETKIFGQGRDQEFAVDSRKLNTALGVPKNNHAVPEKTDVKVVGESTRSEVPETALTALHHIENQIDCVLIIKNSVKHKP